MTEKNPLLYIEHILASIKLIQKYLGDCSKEQLSENHMMYDAIHCSDINCSEVDCSDVNCSDVNCSAP